MFISLILAATISSCGGGGDQFASYKREYLGKAQIGSSVTKQITLQNPSLSKVQHISGLNFDTGTNSSGNFRIDKVEVGGVAQNPKTKDISIPAGSILQIYITYEPLSLDTTIANYGGWATGQEARWSPKKPPEKDKNETDAVKAMTVLISKDAPIENTPIEEDSEEDAATHRAIIAAVYDYPQAGTVQIEVVGEAIAGPEGEISATGGGGECPDAADTLCYTGGFAIELPDIMATGPKELKMTGPAVFKLVGSTVTTDMSTFPAELLVLKGNGPGEPLEGKPINAVSIVLSGAEGVTATGTFDGSRLEINGIAFRIRVVLGEITEADINPGLQAAVDFAIKDLTLETTKPFTNGSITLKIDTTLSKEPSGNAMFDQFLGNARVVVTMDGTLAVN
ncbi:MAG: hypothetical protein HYY43_01965 [Deltaproteobacteria bacterium]|nr:hypothetical protein [Deltaproteobacteria bacterium]